MNSQFDRFLSEENFELAYLRIRTSPRNLYKELIRDDLRIFGLFLNDNIRSVINSIKEDTYEPSICHKVFIPKKNLLVRPLSFLNFIDLLVYQAIINVIADNSVEKLSPYYNIQIFGNQANKSTIDRQNAQFFYKPWKHGWKAFQEHSRLIYSHGYQYLGEFDIASFFDTIDHSILTQILKNDYKIDSRLCEILEKCLNTWTQDNNQSSFKRKSGIPQGPNASAYLSELYLHSVDREIIKLKNKEKYDFVYFRYVDDIRIFTKTKLTNQKLMAALDLFSRDLGLIPQATKQSVNKVENIDVEIKAQFQKFSLIANEYKAQHDDKPQYSLKPRTHKKLKKQLFQSFDKNNTELYLNKTVISFSLYKLNKDEDIKNLLIDNFEDLLTHVDAIFYYLSHYFPEDLEVNKFIHSILENNNTLFHHIIALCFKYFPKIEFSNLYFEKYFKLNNRHWLTSYQMLNWLSKNKKTEIIQSIESSENYFIEREKNYTKYICSNDEDYLEVLSKYLLKKHDAMLALQGLYFLFDNYFDISTIQTDDCNPYVKYIIDGYESNIICETLLGWSIEGSEKIFIETCWFDESEFKELKICFNLFLKNYNFDASKSIQNLNLFNELLFNQICHLLTINKKSDKFGINLDNKKFKDTLPITHIFWKKINDTRNQKTDAHVYDKMGKVRTKITFDEILEAKKNQIECLLEICSHPLLINNK